MSGIRSPELLIAVIGGAAVVVIGLVLAVSLLFVPRQFQQPVGGPVVTSAYWSPERRSVVLVVRNGGSAPTYITKVLVEGVTCEAPGVPTPSRALLVNVSGEDRVEIPAGYCIIVTGLAKSYRIEVELSGGRRLESSVVVY
jgi:hypothetical protein